MSLNDALLLEESKLDVWIAVRTDGVKGSGTEQDPYDVSVRTRPILTGITISRVGMEATVTAINHGYTNGNVVVIAGATGADGALYNGTFPIYGFTQNTFKYAMSGTPGSSAMGSLTCTVDPYEFDTLMRILPVNTTVHLGPGTFQTKGFSFSAAPVSWQPRSGWKMIGSGIDVTVLKLVEASNANAHYTAIGNFYYDPNWVLAGFEASDLTVDCNLGGQPIPAGSDFAPVACAAIVAGGSHIRLRRIRATNFGTQGFGPTTQNPECFVMFTGWAHPAVPEAVDCVTEDCIVEKPSENNTRETSCIGFGVGPVGAVQGYHRGCIIRNCVVDCEYSVRPVRISQITFSGTAATVTTMTPHGRAVNEWTRIAGALVNGLADNPFNGSFKITAVPNSTQFQYTMASTPSSAPTGDMWVDRFSSHLVSVSGISPPTGTGPYTVTVVTFTPHFRVPGNNVALGSVVSSYNGSFVVKSVPDPRTLTYEVAADPGPPPGIATVGVPFHALGVTGGTGAVLEGCRVFHARFGNYGDFYSSKDLVVRNNHFHDVACGVYQNKGTLGETTQFASNQSITYDWATNIATFTTPVAHGLLAKSAVRITGAQVGLSLNNPYNGRNADGTFINSTNGIFEVLDVTATTFRYQLDANPGQDATPNTGQYAEYWRIRRLVVENNLVELAPSQPTLAPSCGILLADYSNLAVTSLQVYLQIVIRGNVIRELNDVPDPSSAGIALAKCGKGLIEENVIDPAVGTAIFQYFSGALEYFANATPAGALLQGYDGQQSRKVDELTTKVEDSLLLAIW